MTTYQNTDILSSIPTCQCGFTHGGHRLYKMCKKCSTMVERPAENIIAANIWLRVPDKVDGFIHPTAWIILTNLFSSTGYNIVEWLVNPFSKPPSNVSKVTLKKIEVFEANGWQRGLNNFIRNFDQFLAIIPQLKIRDSEKVIRWLITNRESLFPKHYPLPSKALLVLENTAVGSFADTPIIAAIDAARSISTIFKEGEIYPTTYIERRVVGVIKNLTSYLWDTIKLHLNKKRGWIRGQLFRSRGHFCMRGVITSISGAHHYEEVHIPWAQGLELFKVHLISKLLHRGYKFIDAFNLIEASGRVYIPLLAELFRELIAETSAGLGSIGIPCTLQRNPTLVRAASQCLFITWVKDDINDQTISFSPLCTKGPNADFDGDEMNLSLLPSKQIIERAYYLRPHYAIHNLSSIGCFTSNVSLPEVTVSILANFINSEEV